MSPIKILLIFLTLSTIYSVDFPYNCGNPNNRPNICTMEYVAVCGWFYKNISCFAYPCAINGSNPCVACSNSQVENVTLGACPSVGSIPITNNTNSTNNNTKIPNTSSGNFIRSMISFAFVLIFYF